MINAIVQLTYLAATGLFIFSLIWMSDPKPARKGVYAGVAAWRWLSWPPGASPSSSTMA